MLTDRSFQFKLLVTLVIVFSLRCESESRRWAPAPSGPAGGSAAA